LYHSPIIICNALNAKGWVTLLTLCAIEIAGRARRPLNVDLVRQSAGTGKTGSIVVACHQTNIDCLWDRHNIFIISKNPSNKQKKRNMAQQPARLG
jgi:hypothetical protein